MFTCRLSHWKRLKRLCDRRCHLEGRYHNENKESKQRQTKGEAGTKLLLQDHHRHLLLEPKKLLLLCRRMASREEVKDTLGMSPIGSFNSSSLLQSSKKTKNSLMAVLFKTRHTRQEPRVCLHSLAFISCPQILISVLTFEWRWDDDDIVKCKQIQFQEQLWNFLSISVTDQDRRSSLTCEVGHVK